MIVIGAIHCRFILSNSELLGFKMKPPPSTSHSILGYKFKCLTIVRSQTGLTT